MSVKMNRPTLNYYLQHRNLYILVSEKFTPLNKRPEIHFK